jgi:hypothetical protein
MAMIWSRRARDDLADIFRFMARDIVKIHTSWQKEREQGRTEGRSEGRAEGRAEQAARAVLTVLRVRRLEVRDEARERILAETDPERLERWHERALVAGSLDEVFAEPS